MKTLLTLLMPALVVVTGVASVLLFNKGLYNLSAVCILLSHLALSAWVYVLSSKKPALS